MRPLSFARVSRLAGAFSLAAAWTLNAQAGSRELRGFDQLVTSAMQEWKVPGLAIAVVRDTTVLLSRGYGHRDAGRQLPVTSHTRFAIGSVTKSFTATVLGMLVDEGRLDWDKPVREYLPDFRLYDRVATEQMTPRDLVTHRSGLPRHDGLWYASGLTRRQLYDRLRYLEPSKEFRSTWQYQNLMFMTAGYLAGQVAGTSWESLVRQRIFGPLGMVNSNFSVTDSQRSDDYALPYAEVRDTVRVIPFRNIDEIGPAGSINSSVDEMIRYVRFHLNQGKWGDAQLLSVANAEQMQAPQMVMPAATVQYDELGAASYGMGFVVSTYRGEKLVQHGGGIDGFISLLSFLPKRRIGVIVLTNFSGVNPVTQIVTNNVFDRLLAMEPVDWNGRLREQVRKARAAQDSSRASRYANRKPGTSPSHPLADYAGRYSHPAYGDVGVSQAGGRLALEANGRRMSLDHFHYDIFEVPPDEPLNPMAGMKLTFLYNKDGDIDRLAGPVEPSVADVVFTRGADPEMTSRAFLEPFAGEYQLSGTIVTVALQGDSTLTLTVPGQPTYTLVPKRGTSFDIKGLTGFTVEFKRSPAGGVVEVVFYQPNGTFTATRR
jgi:CubicO group peptidase (beta-lactamase class C family)